MSASAIATSYPRSANARAASRPAGPEPTTRTFSLLPFTFICSGCQPLRHSSMKVGFCVHRLIDIVISPVMHILQPMHSRMSSTRPSSIFLGKNGSAMEGLAQPIKSSVPERIILVITSGEVKRPTPTIGLSVNSWIPRTNCS